MLIFLTLFANGIFPYDVILYHCLLSRVFCYNCMFDKLLSTTVSSSFTPEPAHHTGCPHHGDHHPPHHHLHCCPVPAIKEVRTKELPPW